MVVLYVVYCCHVALFVCVYKECINFYCNVLIIMFVLILAVVHETCPPFGIMYTYLHFLCCSVLIPTMHSVRLASLLFYRCIYILTANPFNNMLL